MKPLNPSILFLSAVLALPTLAHAATNMNQLNEAYFASQANEMQQEECPLVFRFDGKGGVTATTANGSLIF